MIESSSVVLAALNKELAVEKEAYEKAVAHNAAWENRENTAKTTLIESNDKVRRRRGR